MSAQEIISKPEDINKSKKAKDEILALLEQVEGLGHDLASLKRAIEDRLRNYLRKLQWRLVRAGLKYVSFPLSSDPNIIVSVERSTYIDQAIILIRHKNSKSWEAAPGTWILKHRHEIEKLLNARIRQIFMGGGRK